MLSSGCTYKLFAFAVIMANAPVGFPVPQMQERLDEREALDCFILDYIDYCTVMGWFARKDGCQYDDQSEDGRRQWKKQNLCMSTLRITLPSKRKRLINPNNKTLGLSEEDKSDPVKVIQALVKRFGGSVSVLSERKWDACSSPKENALVRGNVERWSELNIANIRILKIKHAATVLLLLGRRNFARKVEHYWSS